MSNLLLSPLFLLAIVATQPQVVEEKWPDGTVKVRREMGEDLRGRAVRHGMEAHFDDKGGKESETSYRFGELDGPWREFYPNGKLKIEGNYRRGKKDGAETLYSDEGQPFKETNYRDDKKNGKAIEWTSGHKVSEADYDDDRKV